ncbi:hypothetical protein ACFO4E_13265 [Nocardiopsis mangrovi]|uniref:Uncharacterized protein n=1 Tax=Nocardiopsis mangrovi TaxID=1179818 RepID=A0ABV9DXY0_9ACTN
MHELNLLIRFDEDVTPDEADAHTRTLLLRLERLPIDTVELTRGAAEPETRADLATVAGAITLAGFALKTTLPHIVEVITAWLEASGQRSAAVEVDGRRIEVKGQRVTRADVEAYVKLLGGGDPRYGNGGGD